MADPVYSLITDLDGNGPCLAPYPYQDTLIMMLTPCPFEDMDVIPGSANTYYSDLSYGRGFIKATTSESLANANIDFRLKHNGGNRTIKITKSANSQKLTTRYYLKVNNYNDYVTHTLTLGDNILIPPYYRYQLQVQINAAQLTANPEDCEEIWIKAEIL